jgi:hypothetical protein
MTFEDGCTTNATTTVPATFASAATFAPAKENLKKVRVFDSYVEVSSN